MDNHLNLVAERLGGPQSGAYVGSSPTEGSPEPGRLTKCRPVSGRGVNCLISRETRPQSSTLNNVKRTAMRRRPRAKLGAPPCYTPRHYFLVPQGPR